MHAEADGLHCHWKVTVLVALFQNLGHHCGGTHQYHGCSAPRYSACKPWLLPQHVTATAKAKCEGLMEQSSNLWHGWNWQNVPASQQSFRSWYPRSVRLDEIAHSARHGLGHHESTSLYILHNRRWDTQPRYFPGNYVALTPDTELGEQHRETLPAVFSILRLLPRDLGVTSQATVFLPFSQRQ